MTDTAKSPTSSRPTKDASRKLLKGARPGAVSAGLALLLAGLALIATAYLWYVLLVERQELLQTDLLGSITRLEGETRELREALATAEQESATQRERLETLHTGMERMQSDLLRNRTEWVLTETEQLLVIANHRLQLARDVTSALSALRAADHQLNLLANPNLLPVRRELAREIAVLEALEKTDTTGLSLKLTQLAERVERLPLAVDTQSSAVVDQQEAPPPEGWHAAARSLWADVSSLIRIRHQTEIAKPLLPPEQQYFLRENLRLMLHGAGQALLQGSAPIYHQNLKQVTRITREYFDSASQVTIGFLADVDKLQAARIAAELPDISASLTQLRRLSTRRTAAP